MCWTIPKNEKHRVDERWALKSRLFDQFIHDGDRHDDQWRWASIPQGGLAYPVPPHPTRRPAFSICGASCLCDRAGVFYQCNSGLSGEKYTTCQARLTPVPSLTEVLSTIHRLMWKQVALEMQASLADSVIEKLSRLGHQKSTN